MAEKEIEMLKGWVLDLADSNSKKRAGFFLSFFFLNIDVPIDRFTLQNMFAMELGKYQEIAKEIVMNAVKELSIEKGLKDLADVWKMLEFTVVKHYKGNNAE